MSNNQSVLKLFILRPCMALMRSLIHVAQAKHEVVRLTLLKAGLNRRRHGGNDRLRKVSLFSNADPNEKGTKALR
jgi:hypothetical protein